MVLKTQKEIEVSEELGGLIDKFLNVYLPKYRGCSEHTIKSYRTAIYQYLTWVSDLGGSISEEDREIGVLDFNKNQILDWLCYIEENG